MGRMGLDDDRAAGGQRRGRVAAGDREGQREVGRAEDGDRADRDIAQAQVDARHRLAVRHGRIDAGLEERALADGRGEQPELADRAAALAFDAGLRQAGLGHAALDQLVADIHDVLGDRLQEHGACFQIGLAEDRERLGGERAGLFQIVGAGRTEGRLELLAGCRVKAVDVACGSVSCRASDEEVSCQSHQFTCHLQPCPPHRSGRAILGPGMFVAGGELSMHTSTLGSTAVHTKVMRRAGTIRR